MNEVKRKVHWQKWVDPLNSNLNEVEWPGYEPQNVNPKDVEYWDFSDGDTNVAEPMDEQFFNQLGNKVHAIHPVRVVLTNKGLLTVTESATANSHFDFWTLHTNFDITEDVANKIIKSPGVDAFMPLTRYRCRIGFPRSGLFNVTEMKLHIQKILTEEEKNNIEDLIKPNFTDEAQLKIDDKIVQLKQRSKHWALFVFPNGDMEVVESDSSTSNYKSKLSVLEETQKMVGGHIYQS